MILIVTCLNTTIFIDNSFSFPIRKIWEQIHLTKYFLGTFCVKIRCIHHVMLEWAPIKDKINTIQKSQD